jgi:hypothetical protein
VRWYINNIIVVIIIISLGPQLSTTDKSRVCFFFGCVRSIITISQANTTVYTVYTEHGSRADNGPSSCCYRRYLVLSFIRRRGLYLCKIRVLGAGFRIPRRHIINIPYCMKIMLIGDACAYYNIYICKLFLIYNSQQLQQLNFKIDKYQIR